MKTCTGCGLEKPATLEFYQPDKRKKSGIQGPCRACVKKNIEKRYDAIKHTLSVQTVRGEQEVFKLGQAKTCNKCNASKPIESYYLSVGSKDGHRPTCIECWRKIHHRTKEQNREFRLKNLDRIRANDRARIKPECKKKQKAAYDLRRRKLSKEELRGKRLNYIFGISLEQYNDLFKKQNGVCAICFQPENSNSGRGNKLKRLAVDHCHKSGKIRGLLCSHCNRGVGLLKDNPIILIGAARYIKANGVTHG